MQTLDQLSDSSSQNGDSIVMENSTKFNQKIEDMNKKNYQKQIEAGKEEINQKIEKILNDLGKMSKNSQDALPLFQQLGKISPILSEIGAAVNTVDNDVYYKLYVSFRTVFKEFNQSADECTEISKASMNGSTNPDKMKEIKEAIERVAKKLASLQQTVYSQTQRYVVWVDFNDSQENKQTLFALQNQYKTSLTVKFYSKLESFKNEFSQFEGQPLFLILSGQVANDHAPSDGRLFQWIKERWSQDQIKIRIRGIIVYTSDMGVKYIRQKFMEDSSKLVKLVTANTQEMLTTLQNLITPGKFCRVIGLEEFSNFFKEEFKQKLLSMHINQNQKKLKDFHPDNIQLSKIFSEARSLIHEKKINFQNDAQQFDKVLQEINQIYSKYTDEQQIAQRLIYLYSLETIPFYKLINSTLNTLNQSLIEKLWPIIELFATAIYTYDDTAAPESLKLGSQQTILFRGSSIPIENYNELVKVNNFVCLPSFSSFTPDIKVAANFVKMNQFADTVPCIFIYQHQALGSKQFNMRPKYISPHAYYTQEKEFITYPCVCYKISSIIDRDDTVNKIQYKEITLLLN